MAQIGRISGPLLTENLERHGRNISFRNFANDPDLLLLDVDNKFIGINNASPAAAIDVDFTNEKDLISNTALISNISIYNSNIQINLGNLNLNAIDSINILGLKTDSLQISDNKISTIVPNTNIQINPNGSGRLIIPTDLNVYGNLHATGDITMNGQVVFGDNNSEDTVTFNAYINSSLQLTQNNNFDLGQVDKTWKNLYVNDVKLNDISTSNLAIDNIELNLRQGNIFYVAANGSDSNVGDHPQGPFRTVKRALDAADSSTAGPVTIHIFPGVYEEELPLTVPPNTTVSGEDIRNVVIKPTVGYEGNDVFLLNGETTIQNLTIKDTISGYVFRFAANTLITTRSPYIQNVTVITTINGANGALVDGADVNANSQEAGMLFHSCTFLTPNTDALTVTNGARVEWLNSFTYFANRGIYAYNGTTGHLSTDGSTINYGAEIRSIGSANIYGNYGIVGDGNEVIVYAINHNLAYIGAGTDVTNDPTKVISANEIVKSNNAQVYYQAIDHKGKFSVGNNFFVDQSTNTTSLTIDETAISSLTGLTVTTNNQTIFIDGEKINVGNFIFQNNDIKTLAGDLILDSQTKILNFQSNTNIYKNLDLTNDLTMSGGNVTFGTTPTDILNIEIEFNNDLIPTNSGAYNIGSADKKYKKIFLNEANISDITITNNYITTTSSNTNLELRTNGTGDIVLEDIYINGKNIKTINNSFTLSSNSNVNIISTGSLILPIGSTNDRVVSAGYMKFNNDDNLFEVIGNNDAIVLAGVYSSDKQTKVIADPTSNFLSFTTDNNLLGTIDNQQLNINKLEIDDLIIDDNYITSKNTNTNILLSSNLNASINVSDILFKDNTISNTSTNGLIIDNTTKYSKIIGTNGVVIPAGDSNSRGTTNYIGELRVNTDIDNLEVFTGSNWILAQGQEDIPIDADIMAEIVDEIILIYG